MLRPLPHPVRWMLLAGILAHAETIPLRRLTLAGSARMENTAVRLTSAQPELAGAAWLIERRPVANGFETGFEFRVSDPAGVGDGADGFAFVLQNSGPSAVGGKGAGGGFALGDALPGDTSIPRSIAIFFDTFRNAEIGDPSNNFVTIGTAGSADANEWPPPRLASSKKLRVNLKDGKKHTARVEYQPPALTVFLDQKQVLATAVELSTVIGQDGSAWLGFTASTGAGFENHDILSWTFSGRAVSSAISYLKTACLPGRNLCTPEQASAEETGAGLYHLILPGNVTAGIGIPNPDAHAVSISNARGSVCRDVAAQGASQCFGPSALIQRTEGGKTFFSIAAADPSSEGYLEFDAHVE